MGSRGQSAQKARRRAEARAAKAKVINEPDTKAQEAPGQTESDLREELKRIKEREAEIKAKLKEQEASKPKEESVEVYKVFNTEGADGLRRKLQGMSAENLRHVIRENRLYYARQIKRTATAEELVELIVERVSTINGWGDAFRTYHY